MAQRRDEAFRIEDGFGLEHEIDGAGQLDGEHGVGLELIIQPGFEPLGERAEEGIAFGNDGGFTKRRVRKLGGPMVSGRKAGISG
jgi:hypothetical protein